MNLLLVRPISETHIISPPVGLGYLATALRKHNHQVEILDCVKEKMDFRKFAEFVSETKPEAVGFQVWSCDIPFVQKSLQIIKDINPSPVTIVGGAHPSGAPYQVMEHLGNVDFAFRGEAEVGLPWLIDCLSGAKNTDFSKIPGLIWREHGQTNVNDPIFVDDLDEFGLPAWDLIDPREYPQAPHEGFAKAFPTAPIVVSRGCPYSCTFCATHTLTGKKTRFRSINSVVEEIMLLKGKYGVREIHIEDDNFTVDKHFVESFCQRLIDVNSSIYWHCSSGVRVDLLNSHMLKIMKKAGCYNVTIAVESGVERILKRMKKGSSLRQVERAVKILNESGFEPVGLFMIGFQGET
ncbi:B12-binding domain-containing radical SAM protein, partial [bacterium]|nr:B12-binding domain-containing radical SAM protein [bacterium]